MKNLIFLLLKSSKTMYNQLYGSDYMEIILIFIAYVVFFYSFYKIVFWFKGRKKKNELYGIIEIYFLEHKFNVDVKEIGVDKLLNIVALSNAVIFTIVLMLTALIDNFIIRLLVMFVLLMPLIYIMYYGVSKFLKKKGNKKNV